jgi:hypothetical protein
MTNKQGLMEIGLLIMLAGFLGGCASGNSGNNSQVQIFPSPIIEAGWIRNGEPIIYDGYKWYPVKDYEVLQDSEVLKISVYKGVQVFVEKIAVKPYERIYTKFAKNKFRYFERRDND